MKYRPKDMMMWDAWALVTEGEIHLFHLCNICKDSTLPGEAHAPMGHAVSRDLLHWEECPKILAPFSLEENPLDCNQRWTGSAILHEGKPHLAYTMRDQYGNQRTGMAVGDTPYTLEPYCKNPVMEPDERFFLGYKKSKPWDCIVDCRDLHLIPDPGGKGYLGYFAACVSGEYSPKGAVGICRSDDLIHFEQLGVAFLPEFTGVIEVPEVFYQDGKWYLIALTGTHYGGRGVFSEPDLQSGTIYATSDSPLGPFKCGEHNVLIGGSAQCGYSIRTIQWNGKRYAFYTTKENGYDKLSLPKRVETSDGRLVLKYDELLAVLRQKNLCGDTAPDITGHPKSSFAWETRGGEWALENNIYHINTVQNDWQTAYMSVSAHNLEIEAEFEVYARAAGFEITDGTCRTVVLVEPERGRAVVTDAIGFNIREQRHVNVDNKFHLRVMITDESMDVYINDILTINTVIENKGILTAGLFADSGEVTVKSLCAYALED